LILIWNFQLFFQNHKLVFLLKA